MLLNPTRYYYKENAGHSCEDFHTGEVYRFWYDAETWMAEKIRFATSEVNNFDCVDFL